jgi:hypothetical protein
LNAVYQISNSTPVFARCELLGELVDLLCESARQVGPLLERYARVLAGIDDGRETWRQLRVLNQLGVTRGTLQLV